MPIWASSSGGTSAPFELCPPGPQRAVCCDVIDHGMVPSQFAGKAEKLTHKITIRWQSERKMPKDGHPPYLVQRRFTLSLGDKAALRKYLEAWRGKAFTADELKKFDVERLLGVNCQILVTHEQKPRGAFAEVIAIFPPAVGVPPLVVEQYIRVKDRPKDAKGETDAGGHGTDAADYDDTNAPPDQRVPDAPF